ncbi:hypothetical protein FRC06_010054 [Ceratobasidium sp. 370]|nr:hypothetical protein FRC06_010054 [Ceratobasidium sp. 370]
MPVQPKISEGRPRILSALDVAYVRALLEQTPDLYLDEIRTQLFEARGMNVSENTLWRQLRRSGLSLKKLARPALEADENRRAGYMVNVGMNYRTDQLVFVDESHCNRHTARRNLGWSPYGVRSIRPDYFMRGVGYSMLPALSLDGILHFVIQEVAFTAPTFTTFISDLLLSMNPFPGRNSVIVMDNAPIHKSEAMRQMILARGCRVLYLPPYSPDLNPIEQGFSVIKAKIRRNRDLVLGEMAARAGGLNPYRVLWDMVFDSVTPDHVPSYEQKWELWLRAGHSAAYADAQSPTSLLHTPRPLRDMLAERNAKRHGRLTGPTRSFTGHPVALYPPTTRETTRRMVAILPHPSCADTSR